MKKQKKITWQRSFRLQNRVRVLIKTCELSYIDTKRVYCKISRYAKTRALARIWGLSRIFQETLNIKPAYIIEVVSEKFNKLSKNDQDKVLIHELLHIPKNFSGALVAHRQKGGVNERRVWQLYKKLNKNSF